MLDLQNSQIICLQKSKDFEGSFRTNPYIFVPFQKFQFFLNVKACVLGVGDVQQSVDVIYNIPLL